MYPPISRSKPKFILVFTFLSLEGSTEDVLSSVFLSDVHLDWRPLRIRERCQDVHGRLQARRGIADADGVLHGVGVKQARE